MAIPWLASVWSARDHVAFDPPNALERSVGPQSSCAEKYESTWRPRSSSEITGGIGAWVGIAGAA